MRALLQRVSEASVVVNGDTVAAIGPGLLVLLGVERDDGDAELSWMADKVLGLRIFADENDAMNRSLVDVAGEILVVSQFTLAADTSRGRRPGFSSAAPPERAEPLYEQFLASLEARGVVPQKGVFGADMKVHLINDGPVTFLLERRTDG